MTRLEREVESDCEKEKREEGEKKTDTIIQAPPSLASRLIVPSIVLLVIAGIWVGFRVIEDVGYNEIAVVDCGDSELLVLRERGITYIGFCKITVYKDDFTFDETSRTTLANGKPAEINYQIEIDMPKRDEDMRTFYRKFPPSSKITFAEKVKEDVRRVIVQSIEEDCERPYCFESLMNRELSPQYFQWGVRFDVRHLSIYSP